MSSSSTETIRLRLALSTVRDIIANGYKNDVLPTIDTALGPLDEDTDIGCYDCHAEVADGRHFGDCMQM